MRAGRSKRSLPAAFWSARAVVVVIVAGAAAAGGCTYSPQFEDNQLKCSTTHTCPEGYMCVNDACSSTKVDAGLGGDTIPQTVFDLYVGRWTLGPTSSVTTRCGSAPAETAFLSPLGMPMTMTIDPGIAGRSDLESKWLCNLGLRLERAGAHLVASDPNCTDQSGDLVQSWAATRFDIVANNGITAMHSAAYNRVDRYNDGRIVNCAQTVTAPLTRN